MSTYNFSIISSDAKTQAIFNNAIITSMDVSMNNPDIEYTKTITGYIERLEPRSPIEVTLTFVIPSIDEQGNGNISLNNLYDMLSNISTITSNDLEEENDFIKLKRLLDNE